MIEVNAKKVRGEMSTLAGAKRMPIRKTSCRGRIPKRKGVGQSVVRLGGRAEPTFQADETAGEKKPIGCRCYTGDRTR